MTTMNPTERPVPPPTSWEVFEDLCLALFRAIWQDGQAQKKATQTQEGVDIVGINHAEDGGTWGVQCVSMTDGQSVSIARINQDVAKADQFRPKLAGLIIATTTLADGRVLQHCKISTNERAAQGLFPVLVYDWDKLQTLLRAHPQVAKKFYPDLFATPINWPSVPLVSDFFDPLNSLALLKRQMQADSSVVVQGVSGIGKTQLALKYCHDNKNNYAGVWWFQADTASTLLQEGILFCYRLGIPLLDNEAAASAMLAWLAEQEQRQARWLLVFDNAQDVKVVRNFLPPLGQHDVIITSHIANWPGLGNVALSGWPAQQVVDFFKQKPNGLVTFVSALNAIGAAFSNDPAMKAAKKASDAEEKTKAEAMAKAQKGALVTTFGSSQQPLVVKSAVAYMRTKEIELFSDYCGQVVANNAKKSKIGTQPFHSPFLAAFELSFSALSTPAKVLLGLCSWFASKPIPSYLLTAKPDSLPPDIQTLASDQAAWQRTISELKDYALSLIHI
jgi:outer membrane murein-binding lipoprotein Lpp